MGELVDQDEPWLSRQRPVEVELFERDPAVLDALFWKEREADDERPGLIAPVRLDDAHDDIALEVALRARGLEHRIRFSDTRRGPEEDNELAPLGAALLLGNLLEQPVRVGPLLVHGEYIRSIRLLLQGVEREIELENVDARLPEEAERAPFRVVPDQRTNPLLIQVPNLGHPMHLIQRGGRCDVGVETAA